MGTRARYMLTVKGERFVALMRLGVISEEGHTQTWKGRKSTRPTCPSCRRFVEVTPRGYVRLHRSNRKECRGTGLMAVTG